MESLPGPHPEATRRPGTLSCSSPVARALPSVTLSHTEATLSLSGEDSNSGAQPGTCNHPRTPLAPLSQGNSEKEQVQLLSRRMDPEPELCLELSHMYLVGSTPAQSCRSGSSPPREVMFHIPRTSLQSQEFAHPDPPLHLCSALTEPLGTQWLRVRSPSRSGSRRGPRFPLTLQLCLC